MILACLDSRSESRGRLLNAIDATADGSNSEIRVGTCVCQVRFACLHRWEAEHPSTSIDDAIGIETRRPTRFGTRGILLAGLYCERGRQTIETRAGAGFDLRDECREIFRRPLRGDEAGFEFLNQRGALPQLGHTSPSTRC